MIKVPFGKTSRITPSAWVPSGNVTNRDEPLLLFGLDVKGPSRPRMLSKSLAKNFSHYIFIYIELTAQIRCSFGDSFSFYLSCFSGKQFTGFQKIIS